MLPVGGYTDHVTPVLPAPVTVAVNCWVCDAPSATLAGLTDTPTPVCGVISMAFTVGVDVTAVHCSVICPLVTFTANDRSTAFNPPPAAAATSKFVSAGWPLSVTLKTRCPGEVKYNSANFRFTL